MGFVGYVCIVARDCSIIESSSSQPVIHASTTILQPEDLEPSQTLNSSIILITVDSFPVKCFQLSERVKVKHSLCTRVCCLLFICSEAGPHSRNVTFLTAMTLSKTTSHWMTHKHASVPLSLHLHFSLPL